MSVCAQPHTVMIKQVYWSDQSNELLQSILQAKKSSLLGRAIDDTQLAHITERLTQDLRLQGYLIAQVVVSSQDQTYFWNTGFLHLSVFLGRVGQIQIKNTSSVNEAWVDAVANRTLCPDGVGENCILTKNKFERMTNLLEDTAGLKIGSLELSPDGVSIGQTKLIITVVPSISAVNGSVGVDNNGFSSTGRYRTGVSVGANNIFGVGDVFALSAFVSNQGALSGVFDLSGPLSSNGLRWQSSLSRTQFFVSNVNTSGFGNSASAGLAYPLMRSLDANWTAGLNAVVVSTNMTTNSVTTADKTLVSGQITLDGNSGDRSIKLGQDTWFTRVALANGQVKDAANPINASGSLGNYTKLAFQGLGKLVLDDPNNIFVALNIRGQVANTNLDDYEKQLIGGANAMRAYAPEQGSFNQGTITSLELRKVINTEWGQLIPMLFADYANGWINHSTYPSWQINSGYSNPTLSNHMVLSDAGLGLDWNSFSKYSLSVSWARRLPMSPAGSSSSGNSNSQFWFAAKAFF
ncbi:ShlB/FhaC/HecB family hemolysin secretion/activation protein [Polynucleobacter sp. JS-Fieb-80-E5]|uniref:ShlB/FhaC/HecB family hemolysin secretion/activation protein n=1 Tax=Polynucleobacter sp. JS-Fieb-80-E5 TaxID=2081050 RepID=UPI001C0B57A2|nr:ShlB/FhaC/HecB family hemolysin secretion/activation protein [Polynucleobacter sp. JS-Fieb-80-E5]MBU3617851.1 ShlB/FhaC/HecB family hemolysin secretion/activation protein [Polynucleobacter sp. JS-Fieb-80-E5]